MIPPRVHLVVATPCFGGMVTQIYMKSIIALLQAGAAVGFEVTIEMLGYESLITRGRNTLITRFLDRRDATHLFFIDADIGFAIEQVARMLSFDVEFVAGMYPLKLIDWGNGGLQRALEGEDLETAPLRYVGAPCEGAEHEERDGFVTGLYAGTGFMLLQRCVLTRLIAAHPTTAYNASHTGADLSASAHRYALFDCMIEPDTGHYLSEDYTFCRRWRDIGGTIWLDTRGSLTHVGSYDFVGRPDRRFG